MVKAHRRGRSYRSIPRRWHARGTRGRYGARIERGGRSFAGGERDEDKGAGGVAKEGATRTAD
jgi:hypothetical protein